MCARHTRVRDLSVDVIRERGVSKKTGPIVSARDCRPEPPAGSVDQPPRIFACHQALVECFRHDDRTRERKRELRRDYQGNARLMQSVSDTCAGAHDRADVAAVAASHGDHAGPSQVAALAGNLGPHQRRKVLRGDDVFFDRVLAMVKRYPIPAIIGLREGDAMREDVDVRIAARLAFALKIRNRCAREDFE